MGYFQLFTHLQFFREIFSIKKYKSSMCYNVNSLNMNRWKEFALGSPLFKALNFSGLFYLSSSYLLFLLVPSEFASQFKIKIFPFHYSCDFVICLAAFYSLYKLFKPWQSCHIFAKDLFQFCFRFLTLYSVTLMSSWILKIISQNLLKLPWQKLSMTDLTEF